MEVSESKAVVVERGRTPEQQNEFRQTWLAIKEQATFAFQSGLLPKGIANPQQAITIALMGRDLNLSPMQSLTGLYVVNGMVALRGSLMLRLIYERVPGARITVLTPPEKANDECEVEMVRPHGQPMRFKFTVEDAKKAGFMGKATWQQHTATMLRWAAIRTGARIVFADAIAGCYMEDEIPEHREVLSTSVEVPNLPGQTLEEVNTSAAKHGVPPIEPEKKPAPDMTKLGWKSNEEYTQAWKSVMKVAKATGWTKEGVARASVSQTGTDILEVNPDEMTQVLDFVGKVSQEKFEEFES
jgi:hypothetical protein